MVAEVDARHHHRLQPALRLRRKRPRADRHHRPQEFVERRRRQPQRALPLLLHELVQLLRRLLQPADALREHAVLGGGDLGVAPQLERAALGVPVGHRRQHGQHRGPLVGLAEPQHVQRHLGVRRHVGARPHRRDRRRLGALLLEDALLRHREDDVAVGEGARRDRAAQAGQHLLGDDAADLGAAILEPAAQRVPGALGQRGRRFGGALRLAKPAGFLAPLAVPLFFLDGCLRTTKLCGCSAAEGTTRPAGSCSAATSSALSRTRSVADLDAIAIARDAISPRRSRPARAGCAGLAARAESRHALTHAAP